MAEWQHAPINLGRFIFLLSIWLEDIVQTVNVDIAIVGAGGGGLRAAIAAAEETTTDGFVVRSIKRRPSNKWNS